MSKQFSNRPTRHGEVRFSIKNCRMCGVEFEPGSPNQQFCENCEPVQNKERNKNTNRKRKFYNEILEDTDDFLEAYQIMKDLENPK